MNLCSRCGKNPAVIFISKIEGDKTTNEGLCISCAKELGIAPITQMIENLGLQEDDLDNLNQEMMDFMGSMEGMDVEGMQDMMIPDEGGAPTAPLDFLQKFMGSPKKEQPNGQSEQKKQERWQKIAEEAAKQSGRGIVPTVEMPMTLKEVLSHATDYDLFFVPYECETKNNIKSVLTSVQNPKKVAFLIGPEGGFDLSEIEEIKTSSIKTITLGKRILRTETAGEAVLSMIMYEIGDINA